MTRMRSAIVVGVFVVACLSRVDGKEGTFVFSTILGWSYYGEKAIEYLLGSRAVTPYRLAWVAAVMIGSVATLPAVWAFADIANGLMAIPNLISLLALSGVVVNETRLYLWSGDLDRDSEEAPDERIAA